MQEMVEHCQGFASENDEDFAGRAPRPEIVSECLSKAAGMTLEGFGYQVEDMAKQGVASFREAVAQETAGLTEGDVQAGVSDEGFGILEAVDVAGESEEEDGEAGADASDGGEGIPGMGIVLEEGVFEERKASGSPGGLGPKQLMGASGGWRSTH